MKLIASLLLAALAAIVAVQANVQPTPAPRVEKRQSSFDPYNYSQYTNGAAISSLSAYINSEFGSLDSMSLGGDYSSYLASQRSQAYSYLSVASSIAANGGASNSDLSSVLGSLTATMTGNAPGNGIGNVGSNSGQGNGLGNVGENSGQDNGNYNNAGSGSGSASTARATSSSMASNAAVGAAGQMSGVVAGMAVCTFVAALAGTFML